MGPGCVWQLGPLRLNVDSEVKQTQGLSLPASCASCSPGDQAGGGCLGQRRPRRRGGQLGEVSTQPLPPSARPATSGPSRATERCHRRTCWQGTWCTRKAAILMR